MRMRIILNQDLKKWIWKNGVSGLAEQKVSDPNPFFSNKKNALHKKSLYRIYKLNLRFFMQGTISD